MGRLRQSGLARSAQRAPCFGGLDLSTTTDVTALAWVFPPEDEGRLWHVLSRYFVPEENLS